MQNIKFKVLVSDIDGTLLDSFGKLSLENIESINEFRKNGGKFALATGRAPVSLDYIEEKLDLSESCAIVYSGAAIYDFKAKKCIWKKYLHESSMEIAKRILSEYKKCSLQVYTENNIYLIRDNEILSAKGIKKEYVGKINDIEDIPKDWIKIVLSDEVSNLEHMRKAIFADEKESRFMYSSNHFVEIVHKDVSKGNACKMLAEMFGFSINEFAAIGDNFNDYDMIKTVGLGMCPENSRPEIKKIASIVLPSNNENCVAKAVEYLLKETL